MPKIKIEVFRDSHGYWRLEPEDVKKFAPNLEIDSSIILDVTVSPKERKQQ